MPTRQLSASVQLVHACGPSDHQHSTITSRCPTEDRLIRAISFTQANARANQAAASMTGAAGVATSGASSSGGGSGVVLEGLQGAWTAVSGLVQLPFTRESAKQKLRQELRGALHLIVPGGTLAGLLRAGTCATRPCAVHSCAFTFSND